jgi:hypothetical protein
LGYNTNIQRNVTRKLPVSCFSFYLFLFSSAKWEKRRAKQVLPRGQDRHQWKGEGAGKEVGE